jgi:predicted metal-dependent hydrolase
LIWIQKNEPKSGKFYAVSTHLKLKNWLKVSAPQGVSCYENDQFFEAHEAWEQSWKELPIVWRTEIQAWIMDCGVRIHLAHQKIEPAQRLAKRALELLAEAAAHRALQNVESASTDAALASLDDSLIWFLASGEVKRLHPRFRSGDSTALVITEQRRPTSDGQ